MYFCQCQILALTFPLAFLSCSLLLSYALAYSLILPYSCPRQAFKVFPINCLELVVTESNCDSILFILVLSHRALTSLFFSALLVSILPYYFQPCFSFTSTILLFFSFLFSTLSMYSFSVHLPLVSRNSFCGSCCDSTA